ncbi:FAD dependent oxidoreductase [Lentinula raphanica]|nr:FAD dependent oxidoreductase [Lentinula raphanica]
MDRKVLILGAGCFGVSTAFHLLKRGFEDVTIIERSGNFPAKDASSNDINRIVRTSYSDPFYAKLAKEAIKSWREDKDIWEDSYHESGVLVVLGTSDYANEAYLNDKQQGLRIKEFSQTSDIHENFPLLSLSNSETTAYLNYDGGWVDAGRATFLLTKKVVSLGAKLILGKRATRLIREDGNTEAVELDDGTIVEASLVVIAAGPWTPSILPELGYEYTSVATGQCVAMVQLSAEEAAQYRGVPVILDFGAAFYCFPPTDENVVKFAIHAPGITHTVGKVSVPRTVITHPNDGLFIPKTYAQRLRDGLAAVYPDLATKEFSNTRLCWYNDSPDGDWIIGRHSTDQSIMFATGGSGHAFKFLPVIGRLVADAIQGTLDPLLERKFAFKRDITHVDGSRDGIGMVSEELNVDELWGPKK